MPNLPWGFTNSTAAAGDVVVKRYVGPDAAARRTAERAFFTAFAGVLPVPRVLSAADCPELHTQRLPGVCGTDVIEEGHAGWVFPTAGALLRNVAQNAELLPGRGATVVHGDFGPQNLLVDTGARVVTGLVDAEWSGRAGPDSEDADAAWFEWIIRFHHPRLVATLPAFYSGYGRLPAWPVRHELMLRRCDQMLDFAGRRDAAGVERWRERLAATRSSASRSTRQENGRGAIAAAVACAIARRSRR